MEKKSKSSSDLLNAYEQKIEILEQIKDAQADQINVLKKIIEAQKEINSILTAERDYLLYCSSASAGKPDAAVETVEEGRGTLAGANPVIDTEP